MTASDLTASPDLRRWLDDAVERRIAERLREIFERAADEIQARLESGEHVAFTAAGLEETTTRVDEVREPVPSPSDLAVRGLGYVVAEVLERAVAPDRIGLRPREVRALPDSADRLPSTLPELRAQSLSTAEAAARLGVNASRIRQRLLARTLYGFKSEGSWWVPEFQLAGDRPVPGVDRVFPEVPTSASPVAVARWFVTPWEDLVVDEEREIVVSPRAWLLEGRDPAPVVAQARLL